jgi:hypothetical protein
MANAKTCNNRVKVLYIGIGAEENVEESLVCSTKSSISMASNKLTSSHQEPHMNGKPGDAACMD